MKFSVEKNYFTNELRLFQGIFEKKNLMEILQNIKITLLDTGPLELVATDLEIGLTTAIPVNINEPGTFTVNGRDLYELISRMPDGIVEIYENNDLQILITNDKKTSKFKLLGLQSADYPRLPVGNFSSNFNLNLNLINEMINKNYFVVSPEMKFNLGGALISFSKDKIEMAATDGHRLSYTYYMQNNDIQDTVDFIVSRKTLLELNKIGETGELLFSYDKNNIFLKVQNRVLSSRIIDQKFPNYKAVIPEKTQYSAIINKDELLQALRRVLIFKTRHNGVIFKFSSNQLILERSTPERGEAHEEISIEYNGKDHDVAFNGQFILDFLNHIDTEFIEINLNDKENSFVFQPHGNQLNIHFVYVVMPLNI